MLLLLRMNLWGDTIYPGGRVKVPEDLVDRQRLRLIDDDNLLLMMVGQIIAAGLLE